jgi:DNA-binding SARP family transcriptional activator
MARSFDVKVLGAAGAPHLDRRTAGVLAYLALEGPTPKYRLAGLLWASSTEERARNNMRQLLSRLRQSMGGELIVGQDVIELSDEVTVDAAQFEAHMFAGRHTEAWQFRGKLLDGFDYDDCPDFDAWVLRAREAVSGLRKRAGLSVADRLEEEGRLPEAISVCEELLTLDPYVEPAYQRLMRLHYRQGNRPEALAIYDRCLRLLDDELDVDPHPETQSLAKAIEQGQQITSSPSEPRRPRLPLSVQRPPTLVGREREWEEMQQAWDAGQVIFLSGPAGVGKTRLATDFAQTKGTYLLLDGRPGDRQIPNSSHARFMQRQLEGRPDIVQRLAPWARRELSRVAPSILPEGETFPPPLTPENHVRFLEAQSALQVMMDENVNAILIDDLQFVDQNTAETGFYFLRRHFPMGREGGLPPYILCYRRGELPQDLQALVDGMVAGKMGVLLELQPLDLPSVRRLLETLEVPEAVPLAEELSRYTGGNPLFIVETLKHLWETGNLADGFPGRLPPPGRVLAVIQQRLDRLSPQACQLAQVAALAVARFNLEVAGEVLEVPPLSLAPAVAELEATQVLLQDRFSHDLVFEAVRARIPSSVAVLIHRRLSVVLGRHHAPEEVVRQHRMEGDRLFAAARGELEPGPERDRRCMSATSCGAPLLVETAESDRAPIDL